MRARGLEMNLVASGHIGASDIYSRNTSLRAEGLLPTGGRGIYAPEIEPKDAAYMLLGLASQVAGDAGAVAKEYAKFVDPNDPIGLSLLGVLTDLLSDAGRASTIDEIRLCRTRKWAMIIASDGSRKLYRPKRKATYSQKEDLTGGREEYVIGAAMFHQIAIDLEFDQGFPGVQD